MSSWARNVMCLWLFLTAGVLPLCAATKAEEKAFQEASLAFNNRNWERAERELGEFVQKNPLSEFRAEALLLQAESRIKLGNFDGAIQLLEGGRDFAGRFGDEYLFWLAEAQFQSGKLPEAADSYARFATEFPNSGRSLDAIIGEARTRSQLKQWARVAQLLGDPEGRFQTLAKASPGLESSIRGRFMLAEAYEAQKQYDSALKALDPLQSQPLDPQIAWQRDFLRAKILLALNQPEAALGLATNLSSLVGTRTALRAEGNAFEARLREQMGQTDEAIRSWRLNLDSTIPPERQREALLRVGDLLIRQGQLTEATQILENFLSNGTNAPTADVALLTLGELRLRRSLSTNATTSTNLLPAALDAFNAVLQHSPSSELVGKAQLGLGWCLWWSGNIKASTAAFRAAANALPDSYEQSVARFKLADAQARQGDFADALSNYQKVIAAGETSPEVRSNLVERCLYQVLKAAREVKNDQAANDAMARLLQDYPAGSLIESALITYGRQAPERADPAERREVLQGFLDRSPDSDQAAGVRLAIARTYEQQQDWTDAASAYESWLATYTNNPARPRAEYLRALAIARMGNETEALTLFTNYVAQYPTNDLTPLARWWTADYYWRQEDFVNAEANYQLLFKNHPESKQRFDAQLMAGRSATARQALREAITYFTNLANDVKCPPEIEAQALFAYGDSLMSVTSSQIGRPYGDYETAIQVFSKVAQLYPNTRIALLAQGKIGNCYLQLGGMDTNSAPVNYNFASNAYQRVLNATNYSEFPDRAEAEVGLGLVQEKQAKLIGGTNSLALQRSALNHYLNVVYGNARRVDEPSDMFWVKRAGIEHALPLAESLQEWRQVARLCDTLAAQLPPLQGQLEKRRARAEEQIAKLAN